MDGPPKVRRSASQAGQADARLVAGDGLSRLAEAIDTLEVVAPCGCGDSSCGSFYTSERYFDEAYPPEVLTEMTRAGFQFDALDDQILYIELLGDIDTRERLMRLFPGAK